MRKTDQLLRMRDLVKATGVAKSTILYYIRIKLLPSPIRKKPNFHLYPRKFVDLIKAIRDMQDRYFMPLAVIKKRLKLIRQGVTPDVDAGPKQQQTRAGRRIRMDRAEFLKTTGLSEWLLRQAENLYLLRPTISGRGKVYQEAELEAAWHLLALVNTGVTLEDLAFYPRFAERLAASEAKVRDTLLAKKSLNEQSEPGEEFARHCQALRRYILNSSFIRHELTPMA